MKKSIGPLLFIGIPLMLNGCYKEEELVQPTGKIQYSITKSYADNIEYRSNYYYNKQEELVKIENVLPNNENTFWLYEYDRNGLLTKKTLREVTGKEDWSKYEYDENGQRIKEYTSAGAVNTYSYDEYDRLSKIHYNLNYTSEDVFYLYDSMDLDKIKYEKKFDGNGLVYNLEYKYDQTGLVVEKDLIDGNFIIYNTGPWEQFEYNADGQKTRYIKYNRELFNQDRYLVEEKVDYYYK